MIPIDSTLLGDKAHAILVSDLEARGNVLSILHRNVDADRKLTHLQR